MNDRVVVAALILSFAILVTVHVTIAVGLLRRRPRWRGLLAFVLPPLAPYWAVGERMRVRAVLWVLGLCTYAVARALSA